ncbi:MAG TPA: ATP-binding protein [bacterium]|nr:ATP-binding protein [bacterium]
MKHKTSSSAKRGKSPSATTRVNAPLAEVLEVKPDQLGWTCPNECLKFDTTDDLPGTAGIIGQPRAVDALSMALEIESVGYNVFVSGPVGTGRTTTVKNLLESTRGRPRQLDDKCYVNNFRDPDQPRLLRLAAGNGHEFKRDMDEFIDFLIKNVPQLLESDTYQQRRTALVDGFKERGGARVREFEKRVIAEGFALVQTGPLARPELAPIVEKQPVSIDSLPAQVEEGKLTAERADEIKQKYQTLATELAAIFKEVRELEKQARDGLAELDQSIIRPVVEERLADIEERCGRPKKNHAARESKSQGCPDAAALHDYLAEVKDAVLARPDEFRQKPPAEGEISVPIDPFLEFRVNVLVDNSDTKTAPVIFETNPNYKNLFGSIERVWDRGGQWRADFTKIKAGSVLRADHGFLVVNALDALVEPGVWPALKRTLRNRQLEITGGDPYSALFGAVGMKPEPIAIDLKVIMIGDPQVYSLLSSADEDFRKVFKVRADFDWVMELDEKAVDDYVQVIKALCQKEQLRPFDRSGVRAVIEHGARLAGRTDKLSTRFNIISELLTEASHWAAKAKAKAVGHEHVQEAINRRRDRVRLSEVKLQEAIRQGTIFIDVTGAKAGQVNGLAVYDTGEYAFGLPTRITAKTGVGSAGIINIEREAQLSGPTHDKGVYILSGYLRQKFAHKQPLVLSASICFEQSYGGVDGDSASSTEVYALLSDLSGLPIRQDLAVTGSVNQQGEVQPIGGVNWKIEGFFEACHARGLTGNQGVIIPKANLQELVLRPEVVAAVKAGKFHIYAVSTIDEGVELLTGVPAGVADSKGNYPGETVSGRVMKRLAELAQLYQDFKPDKSNKKKPAKKAKPEKKVPRARRRQ